VASGDLLVNVVSRQGAGYVHVQVDGIRPETEADRQFLAARSKLASDHAASWAAESGGAWGPDHDHPIQEPEPASDTTVADVSLFARAAAGVAINLLAVARRA